MYSEKTWKYFIKKKLLFGSVTIINSFYKLNFPNANQKR